MLNEHEKIKKIKQICRQRRLNNNSKEINYYHSKNVMILKICGYTWVSEWQPLSVFFHHCFVFFISSSSILKKEKS